MAVSDISHTGFSFGQCGPFILWVKAINGTGHNMKQQQKVQSLTKAFKITLCHLMCEGTLNGFLSRTH